MEEVPRRSFAEEFAKAASQIADFSRADLEALLRRVALRIRNSKRLSLEPHVDDIPASIDAGLEIPRAELLSRLLTEWLEDSGYLAQTSRQNRRDDHASPS